jgi:hypothetical protein
MGYAIARRPAAPENADLFVWIIRHWVIRTLIRHSNFVIRILQISLDFRLSLHLPRVFARFTPPLKPAGFVVRMLFQVNYGT